jgi:hypothetical protein
VTIPSTALAYRSRAVRALVLLHDEHVRRFLVVWNQAQAASVVLPKTDDPSYASLETLLRHVLGAARGYMTWMASRATSKSALSRRFVAKTAAQLAGRMVVRDDNGGGVRQERGLEYLTGLCCGLSYVG